MAAFPYRSIMVTLAKPVKNPYWWWLALCLAIAIIAGIFYAVTLHQAHDWGGDFSQWPETFTMYVGHYMGLRIAARLKNDINKDALEKRTRKLLVDARSKDAMQEPTRFPPIGSWVRARLGGATSRGDRGSRTTLIG